jgi:hypothetical protein
LAGYGVHYGRDEERKASSEVGEELADVVAAGAEHGRNSVADGSFLGKL